VRRMAGVLADLGLHGRAAVLLGAEAAAGLKLPLRANEVSRHEAVVRAVREALGRETFERLAYAGAALSVEELMVELGAAVEEAEAL
jgi:hypothetical protein